MSQKQITSVGAFVQDTAQAINDNFTELYAGEGLAIMTADPTNPSDDTWWIVRTGTSPTLDVDIRVRIAGTTYTLAGITL